MNNILEEDIDAVLNSRAFPKLKIRANEYLNCGFDEYFKNHILERIIEDYTAEDMKSIEMGCRQLCNENKGITINNPFDQIEKRGLEKLVKLLNFCIIRQETIEKNLNFEIVASVIKSRTGDELCKIYHKVKV